MNSNFSAEKNLNASITTRLRVNYTCKIVASNSIILTSFTPIPCFVLQFVDGL